MKKNKIRGYGMDFLGLLTIAFIVLRLCKVIDWSWWLVLCPVWAPGAIALILFVVSLVLKAMIKKEKEKSGPVKSKWQERLDDMKAAKERLKR